MIIIFNISCLTAAFISLWLGLRLRKHYNQSKIDALKDYSNTFLFISLAYLLLSLPKLVLFDSFWVQVDFVLVDLSFWVAILFGVPGALAILSKSAHLKRFSFYFILCWILIYIFLSIFFFSSAIPLETDEGLFYWKNGTPWLYSLSWLPLCLAAFGLGLFFLFQIKTIRKKLLFWRSFCFALTGIIVAIAGFLFWISKFLYPSPQILVLSGLIGVVGFLTGVIGVRSFSTPQETWVKKIT